MNLGNCEAYNSWFGASCAQVEEQMLLAVQDQCLKALTAYAITTREDWVVEWPGQVVLVVSSIYWTRATTQAILAGGMSIADFEGACTAQLGRIVELVRGQLTNLNRMTLSALVVMDVHARDTIAVLATEGVRNEVDFLWQSQLRMYWEQNTCWVRMMTAGSEYGYEYLGNSGRLVVTPLTDRCYRTLMGAIHLGMGGAPEGPAGTGKTETTKDLAKVQWIYLFLHTALLAFGFVWIQAKNVGLLSNPSKITPKQGIKPATINLYSTIMSIFPHISSF